MQEQRDTISSSVLGDGNSHIVEQALNELLASSSAPISFTTADDMTADKQLHALYHKSVEELGVRIIPGNLLGVHHQIANFW